MSAEPPSRVITPPNSDPVSGPLVYLAGPVEGAPDWQAAAVRRLAELDPGLSVANPRRELAPGEELALEQLDWETGHLRRAEANGAVLFWMAAEAERVPRRAYAQVARAHVFECKARHELAGARVVVGVEENFPAAPTSGGASSRRPRACCCCAPWRGAAWRPPTSPAGAASPAERHAPVRGGAGGAGGRQAPAPGAVRRDHQSPTGAKARAGAPTACSPSTRSSVPDSGSRARRPAS